MRNLFSAGLEIIVRSIQHFDGNILFSIFQIRSNVESESRVAACVASDPLAVDKDFSRPVYGVKVQDDVFLFPCSGDRDALSVPECLVWPEFPSHSGERGLEAEGDQDLSIGSSKLVCAGWCDGIVPQPVQGLPLMTDHLRPRILRVDRGGIEGLGPGCADVFSDGHPSSGLWRTAGKCCKEKSERQRFSHFHGC